MFKFRSVSLLKWGIILIPLWWFIGVLSLVFHALVFTMFMGLLLRKKSNLYIPKEIIWLISFITVYFVSIIANYSIMPFNRFIATLYNLSFWLEGLMLIVVIYNTSFSTDDVVEIIKGIVFFGSLCAIISVLGAILWFLGMKKIVFYAPVSKIVSGFLMNSLFGGSLSLHVIYSHYTDYGIFPRTNPFFSYATSYGMGMMIMIPLTICYYKIKGRIFSLKAIALIILQILALFLASSRTAILACILAFAFTYFIVHKRTYKFYHKVLIVLVLILCFIVFFHDVGLQTFNYIKDFRKGSSVARFRLYKNAFISTLESPIYGYGHKPKLNPMGLPTASHSTIFSIMFKTGFVGLSFLILFWGNVFRRWKKNVKVFKEPPMFYLAKYLGVVLIGGFMWQCTDDFDAPPLIVFFFFLITGLIISMGKMAKTEVLPQGQINEI